MREPQIDQMRRLRPVGRVARVATCVAACVAASLAVWSTASAGPGASAEPRPGERPDFFLVVIDTARADAFRTWNRGLPVGDALEALARDGIVFERLRSPAPWTRPAVASLLTGLPPTRHQVAMGLDRLSSELETLPTLLHAAGYRTRGWAGNTQVLPVFGFGRGFDEYVDMAGLGTAHHPEASEIFAAAQSAVAGSPVGGGFYYIHIVDPHYPYAPPPAQQSRLEAAGAELGREFPPVAAPSEGPRDPNRSPLRYLAEVRDADTELGRFLDFLRKQGRYEPAMILVVSDHGEELRDHGGQGHGHTLYEELLRVPGVLKLPGNARAGTRVTRDVELQDLAVTVARWLPIEPPSESEGVDALDPRATATPGAYLSDSRRLAAVRSGSWKLIVDFDRGSSALYDLSLDPGEKRDVAAQHPERVAALRATLDRIQTLHAPGWHLRGCGCRGDATRLAFQLAFPVRPAGTGLARIGLEEADRVEIGPDGAAIRFDLTPPILAERGARTGRPVEGMDRDELVLPDGAAQGGGPVLRVVEGACEVAVGSGAPAPLEGELDLSALGERARVRASEPVRCQAQGAASCRPHLRVWYAPPPEALPESELDPGVAERLRALGYTW